METRLKIQVSLNRGAHLKKPSSPDLKTIIKDFKKSRVTTQNNS